VRVDTVKKSIDTRAEMWLARNVRHVWDGGQGRRARSLDTVRSEILNPSLRCSP
jgi:hypothetical protein